RGCAARTAGGGEGPDGGDFERQRRPDPGGGTTPRRRAGQRAEPVLAGLQVVGGRAAAVRGDGPGLPAVVTVRRCFAGGGGRIPVRRVRGGRHGPRREAAAGDAGMDAGALTGGDPDPWVVASGDNPRLGCRGEPSPHRRRADQAFCCLVGWRWGPRAAARRRWGPVGYP